ncbi:type II toxin-antitoxin system RelE/ParE family toxin [Sulfurimonas sp. NWX79]|uniref:type II toxin-antitoxin system RelE/ParE family toxin n=1 Tax=Sulfurimonas sp. NWX79 TaxID=2925412 RepID=UPI00320483A6
MTIKILDDAEKDIAIGISFYESQKDGLGRYFLDSILSDIESLLIYAGIHIVISDYYRLLSKRFPFSIYYKIKEDTVYIYAVLDCRRDPNSIAKRL